MNFTIETRIDVAPDENEYFGIQLLVSGYQTAIYRRKSQIK
jgi:hypothetical protein